MFLIYVRLMTNLEGVVWNKWKLWKSRSSIELPSEAVPYSNGIYDMVSQVHKEVSALLTPLSDGVIKLSL